MNMDFGTIIAVGATLTCGTFLGLYLLHKLRFSGKGLLPIKKQREKIFIKDDEYRKYNINTNTRAIQSISLITFIVFVIYISIVLIIPSLLPDALRIFYLYIYLYILILSLLYFAFSRFKWKKSVNRSGNFIYFFLISLGIVGLSTLDHINTNEITVFVIVMFIIAIIYREKLYIITTLLVFNCMAMLFFLFFFSFETMNEIRLIDVLIYTGISISFGNVFKHIYRRHYYVSLELKKRNQELQELSFKDTLTKLYNRRYLLTFLQNEIKRYQRKGIHFSILMIDIDHFKKINDKFGHISGDKVLSVFAQIALDEFRGEDIVSRYGGEEFTVVLIGTKLETAIEVAERLRKRIEIHKFLNIPYPVTVSIGVAEYKTDETIEELIDRADQKLYSAKKTGRNTVKK